MKCCLQYEVSISYSEFDIIEVKLVFCLISMRSRKTNHINILCFLGPGWAGLGEQRASLARTRRLKVGLKARVSIKKYFDTPATN